MASMLAERAHQHVLVRGGARLGWAGEIDRAGEASPNSPLYWWSVEGLLKR
jgi:hypothetical protein